MAAASGPSEAAQRALLALLEAVPPAAHLELVVGQPASARGAAGQLALGRSPLTESHIKALLGADQLAAALAAGPGPERGFALTLAHKPFVVRLSWQAGSPWRATVAAGQAAPLGASAVAAAVAAASVAASALPAGEANLPSFTAPPSATSADLAPSDERAGTLPSSLRALLATARERRAADLHLQAGQPARLRVGGRLLPDGPALTPAAVAALVAAITPGELAATLEQRGSVDFALPAGALGRFRVNVGRQASGLKICLRCIPLAPQPLSALGLPEDVAAATNYHQGLVMFAGPKGHGKSTTLASVVHAINARSAVHIISIEDPIEVVHAPLRAVISQRQVGTHTTSFARALKAALREDPDVIVIGELRDRETVEIALTAAETGHLVLATIATRSAAKAIDRLIDFFPPDDQAQIRATLAGALKMVISQRLLPGTAGGLLPAVETITGSVPLWTLIRENKMFQLPSLQQRGRSIGMLRLDQSLEMLCKQNALTPRDALLASEQPAELLRQLQEQQSFQPSSEDLQLLGLAR